MSENLDEIELVMYEITCHTEGCDWDNIMVLGQGPVETAFMCGPCGGMVDDWKVHEDQVEVLEEQTDGL
jgi:hypothetical protein